MAWISGIDHIVLLVADVDRSLAFYHGLLGLPVERLEEFRAGRVGFPSVRIDQHFVIDLFLRTAETEAPGRNMDHFCLVTDADDLTPLVDELTRRGVPLLGDVTERWGAQGMAMSIYLLDPDGHRVEIRGYAPALQAEAEPPAAARPS